MTQLFSENAERALLGAAMLNQQVLREVAISADDFYIRRAGMVWETMQRMDVEGKAIDVVMLDIECTKKDSSYGGIVYLSSLANDGVSWNAQDYANEMLDYSRRRKLLQQASKLAQLATEGGNINADISKIIDDVVMSSKSGANSRPIAEYMSQLLDEVFERVKNPSALYGIPSGFADFDSFTGGIQPTESLILSGDSGVGKSMLAMQWGVQMAQKGYPGVIYSLEMSGIAVARRMLSGFGKIESWKLKSGKLTDAEQQTMIEQTSKIASYPMWMCDEGDMGLMDIRSDLAKRKAKDNVSWFILDYMYLLRDASGRDEIEATTQISRGVKTICKSLNLAGISIHSLNKTGMDTNGAKKSMLRGSGQLVYDADVIMLITRDDQFPMQRNITIAKGREIEATSTPKFSLVQTKGYPFFGSASKGYTI